MPNSVQRTDSLIRQVTGVVCFLHKARLYVVVGAGVSCLPSDSSGNLVIHFY